MDRCNRILDYSSLWLKTYGLILDVCAQLERWLACGFLIDVRTGLMSKSSSNGMKSRLNSDPLSKTTRFGRGYLDNHVLLKSWLILAEVLSMYS